MGGHAHGEVASELAIAALADLDSRLASADLRDVDPLATLGGGVAEAARRLAEAVEREAGFTGMGTTLTAMLWDGTRFAVAHIGDSRAYLLRDGVLHRITRDHTMIQALVDDGRLSAQQAAEHPRRSVLMRALQGDGNSEPDLFLQEVRLHDRYLLCSDGVTDVISQETLHQTLTTNADPESATLRLIELANQAGGPDNITCVVGDMVEVPPRRF